MHGPRRDKHGGLSSASSTRCDGSLSGTPFFSCDRAAWSSRASGVCFTRAVRTGQVRVVREVVLDTLTHMID